MSGTVYLPLSDFNYVRSHDKAEEFAKIMVDMRATTLDSAATVTDIEKYMESIDKPMDRKSIYNKLKRPGIVRVEYADRPLSFYYLSEIFVPLANEQGAEYYPIHLGPLAHRRIPQTIIKSTGNSPDVTGTLLTSGDGAPLSVRTVIITSDDIIKHTIAEALPGITELLQNPVGKRGALDNAMVLLGGIRRWLDSYDLMDAESQAYIQQALEE